MTIPYISSEEALSQVSIIDSIQIMKELFKEHTQSQFDSSRHISPTKNPEGLTLFMPAAHEQNQFLGIKISSIRPHNTDLPMVNGVYILIDYVTGQPKALIDSNCITKLRTAAVTAVVTQACLDQTCSYDLGLVGAGAQALAHAEALCKSLEIKTLHVFSRRQSQAIAFANTLRETPWAPSVIKVHRNLTDLLDQASVLTTCTSTDETAPLIKEENLPTTIQHINAIGGRTIQAMEIDPKIYSKADVIVESITEACNDSGELKKAIELGQLSPSKIQKISDFLRIPQRSHSLSIYRSVGLAIEDLFLAEKIFSTILQGGSHERIKKSQP